MKTYIYIKEKQEFKINEIVHYNGSVSNGEDIADFVDTVMILDIDEDEILITNHDGDYEEWVRSDCLSKIPRKEG